MAILISGGCWLYVAFLLRMPQTTKQEAWSITFPSSLPQGEEGWKIHIYEVMPSYDTVSCIAPRWYTWVIFQCGTRAEQCLVTVNTSLSHVAFLSAVVIIVKYIYWRPRVYMSTHCKYHKYALSFVFLSFCWNGICLQYRISLSSQTRPCLIELSQTWWDRWGGIPKCQTSAT